MADLTEQQVTVLDLVSGIVSKLALLQLPPDSPIRKAAEPKLLESGMNWEQMLEYIGK